MLNVPFDEWPRGQQVRTVLIATNKPTRRGGPLWRTAAEYASELGTNSARVAGILRSLEHKRLVEQRDNSIPAYWASTWVAEQAIEVLGT